jgi:hypothetical protein
MIQFLDCFNQEFARLHHGSRRLIETTPFELLYRELPHKSDSLQSGGEHLLRSAAIVEQTFGGLSANLWDDPFEWTLPETLSTVEKVLEYLDEVESTRKLGFGSFKDDEDLAKQIMTPSGPMSLQTLLLDTLIRAVHHQGFAKAILEFVG